MSLPPIDPLLLLDDPAALAVLLAGAPPVEELAPAAAMPPPAAVEAPLPPPPAFALVPEDAFPTVAELDALLAEHAGPPPGPDAALRAALALILGIDPALAQDAEAFDAALAALAPPAEESVPGEWVSDGLPWDAAQAEAVLEDWVLG
jgi:hypothetical protein